MADMTVNKKKIIFKGTATALITPFAADGGVDYESFGKIIDMQAEAGIDALVVNGTTGESCCLSAEERRRNIAFAVRRTSGKVPVIAGTGCNCTALAAEYTAAAAGEGAAAVLVSSPYFNKASEEGIAAHFYTVAEASKLPLIIYDVPSRTGIKMSAELLIKLFEHPNIAAVKEADSDIGKITALMSRNTSGAALYSGGDEMITPLLSIGGAGAVSVVSNVYPGLTRAVCRSFFAGDVQTSARLQLLLRPLIGELFSSVNPIPIKALMSCRGMCENLLRLPLTALPPDKCKKLLSLSENLDREERKLCVR